MSRRCRGHRMRKPVIDRVMPLNEGRKAYEIMEQGGQLGKIVLSP